MSKRNRRTTATTNDPYNVVDTAFMRDVMHPVAIEAPQPEPVFKLFPPAPHGHFAPEDLARITELLRQYLDYAEEAERDPWRDRDGSLNAVKLAEAWADNAFNLWLGDPSYYTGGCLFDRETTGRRTLYSNVVDCAEKAIDAFEAAQRAARQRAASIEAFLSDLTTTLRQMLTEQTTPDFYATSTESFAPVDGLSLDVVLMVTPTAEMRTVEAAIDRLEDNVCGLPFTAEDAHADEACEVTEGIGSTGSADAR